MYSKPTVTELGSLADLTRAPSNKVGRRADQFAPANIIVGSLVPIR